MPLTDSRAAIRCLATLYGVLAAAIPARGAAAESGCTTLVSDPGALRIEYAPAGSYDDAITLVPKRTEDLGIAVVARLSGACRDAVVGHNMPYVYFRDGSAAVWRQRVVRQGEERKERWERIGPQTFPLNSFVETDAQREWPEWNAGEFAGASRTARMVREDGIHVHYLGVWRGPGRSVVASYSQAPDGRFSVPEILASSPLPILSATPWSMIDGITISHGYPRGELGITVDAGETLLVFNVSGFGVNR